SGHKNGTSLQNERNQTIRSDKFLSSDKCANVLVAIAVDEEYIKSGKPVMGASMKFLWSTTVCRAWSVLLLLIAISGSSDPAHAAHDDESLLLKQAQALFKPLPKNFGTPEAPIPDARVLLGRTLYFDPRLTLKANLSCASCHQPALYGTDALPCNI